MTRPLPRARRVLVVAPHPDDEVIGAWRLMQSLSRQGARIDILVVSDGAASHPGSTRWPRPRLVAERRRETLRAMALLSIPRSRVRFLSLPDGQLESHEATVRKTIARDLRRRAPPDLIVGPAPADAHEDHRAVALALAGWRRRRCARLTYHVWPAAQRRRLFEHAVPLDGRALSAKRRAIRSYRTQSGMIDDADAGCTLTARHLHAFVRPTERFERLA